MEGHPLLIGALTGHCRVFVKRDIEYARVGERRLLLDIYVPISPHPPPVILWIHGGGWMAGDKHMRRVHPARRQVSRGYAVASVEYRLSDEASFPAQIHDVKAAIRWVRANAPRFGLDGERIVAWGSSAGGHLAALAGTSAGVPELEDLSMGNADTPSRVQAVVNWFGPTDFLHMGGRHDAPDSPESRLMGCPIQECPDRVAAANPIRYVSEHAPPFLIQHGTADRLVPYNQSVLLHDALVDSGVPVRLVPLKGVGHGGRGFRRSENLRIVEAFLDDTMKPQPD